MAARSIEFDMDDWKERTGMLVGEDGLRRLEEAHVAIIGLGGVGAYAAEMICRSGIGHLLLLDCDTVSVSNRNRQLCALESTIGKRKTEVMAARLRDINPRIDISVLTDFITPNNVPLLLDPYRIDYLVDSIDTLSPKIALISYCLSHTVKMVSSMGAGAKFDATQIRLADISANASATLG
jgi:tRNA A37 threonylcarbamoyladenosine dehydratase